MWSVRNEYEFLVEQARHTAALLTEKARRKAVAVVKLQSFWRMWAVRTQYEERRYTAAAIKLQSAWRMWRVWWWCYDAHHGATMIQQAFRAFKLKEKAVARVQALREEAIENAHHRATMIQQAFRAFKLKEQAKAQLQALREEAIANAPAARAYGAAVLAHVDMATIRDNVPMDDGTPKGTKRTVTEMDEESSEASPARKKNAAPKLDTPTSFHSVPLSPTTAVAKSTTTAEHKAPSQKMHGDGIRLMDRAAQSLAAVVGAGSAAMGAIDRMEQDHAKVEHLQSRSVIGIDLEMFDDDISALSNEFEVDKKDVDLMPPPPPRRSTRKKSADMAKKPAATRVTRRHTASSSVESVEETGSIASRLSRRKKEN